MMICKTKKWGNSLGILIPKQAARELGLKEDEEIAVEIIKKENPLKALFGAGKGKLKGKTEDLLKELHISFFFQ